MIISLYLYFCGIKIQNKFGLAIKQGSPSFCVGAKKNIKVFIQNENVK
jgi:hypothetical protein